MSDSTDPLRRLNLEAAVASANAAGAVWTTLWTWLAAIAAAAVVLAVVFGYSRIDPVRPSGEPVTTGSAPASSAAPVSPPRSDPEMPVAPADEEE